MVRFLQKFNWLFPILIFLALLLGTWGFWDYDRLHGNPPDLLSNIYLSLQLFVLNSGGLPGPIPLTLELSRFLAPALTAGGIFLALWYPLNQNYLLFRIRFWRNHVVVCGLSKKAELLIMDFLNDPDEKYHIVLIESNADHNNLSVLRKRGVIILNGNATDHEELLKANILKAKYLLALTNDEKVNILIAQKATAIYNQHPEKIPDDKILHAIIHIDDFYTMKIFKEFHEKTIPEQEQYRRGSSKIDYHAFSIYQLGAIHMVDTFSPDKYVSLHEPNDPAAHILILGENIAAQYLILEAAQMYHFGNLLPTRITVVADNPEPFSKRIATLYPSLEKTVELRFLSTDAFFSLPCPVPCDEFSLCLLAMDDDGKSVYYSRMLRQHLFVECRIAQNKTISQFSLFGNMAEAMPPIKVLLPRNTALVNIFDDVSVEMHELNIELLNIDDEVCNKRTIVDNRKAEDFIARHIHYEWAKSQALKNNTPVGTMQEEWDKLKDAQKDSNRLPARHLFTKLRFVKAELTNTENGEDLDFEKLSATAWDTIARMEHNRWSAEKNIGGFILIDPVQDRLLGKFIKDNLKCHWDLVPFDDLGQETKNYDTFTFRMAPAIARLNGKRIRKTG